MGHHEVQKREQQRGRQRHRTAPSLQRVGGGTEGEADRGEQRAGDGELRGRDHSRKVPPAREHGMILIA